MELKVGYQTVTVAYMNMRAAHRAGALGLFMWEPAEIFVKDTLSPAQQAKVLVHELIHACFHVYDLKVEGLSEEDVCEALDGPLTALFTDNPLLAGVLHQAVNHGKPILETS